MRQKNNMDRKVTFPKINATGYRAVEFFAGMGGFSTAWPEVDVAVGIDIHQRAAEVYTANNSHPFWIREIESISAEELLGLRANLWWMSPPCQPYTLRGLRRDVDDPRARSLLRLMDLIGACAPEFVVIENVLGFSVSTAHALLTKQLETYGYRWQSIELCPTQMNWPNKRPRFYLMASRGADLIPWRDLPVYSCRTADLIDSEVEIQVVATELLMNAATIAEIEEAIDRCDRNSARATACFASSYGRALLNSGSYLQLGAGRYRRFSPREVANLLGFPPHFILPPSLRTRELWKLLGNGLSLPAVRYVLSHLPGGPLARLPWDGP